MKRITERLIKRAFNSIGLHIEKLKPEPVPPIEFSGREVEILNYVLENELTMVSRERLIATIMACKYVVENEIDGEFVECGVWRGGNSIAAKLVLESCSSDKKVFLFDTFAGMTEPADTDISVKDRTPAIDRFRSHQKAGYNEWCYASLESVRQNFVDAGADVSGVKFIRGDVRQTLTQKAHLPDRISVLRLDTDWYESTMTEMEVLYPLLEQQGVLIIDDYGHWQGSRDAVEDYFSGANAPRPLLQYTDYSGRMGIKP